MPRARRATAANRPPLHRRRERFFTAHRKRKKQTRLYTRQHHPRRRERFYTAHRKRKRQTRLDQLQHDRLALLIPYQIHPAYNGVSNGAAWSAWAPSRNSAASGTLAVIVSFANDSVVGPSFCF